MLCFCLDCDASAVGACVCGKYECFRHADVICLCLVCILLQFSMLHSA